METKGLAALILLGDTNVGNDIYGDFRYYADSRSISHRQAASRRSSINDCRRSDNLIVDIVRLLKQRDVSTGNDCCISEDMPGCGKRRIVDMRESQIAGNILDASFRTQISSICEVIF